MRKLTHIKGCSYTEKEMKKCKKEIKNAIKNIKYNIKILNNRIKMEDFNWVEEEGSIATDADMILGNASILKSYAEVLTGDRNINEI